HQPITFAQSAPLGRTFRNDGGDAQAGIEILHQRSQVAAARCQGTNGAFAFRGGGVAGLGVFGIVGVRGRCEQQGADEDKSDLSRVHGLEMEVLRPTTIYCVLTAVTITNQKKSDEFPVWKRLTAATAFAAAAAQAAARCPDRT